MINSNACLRWKPLVFASVILIGGPCFCNAESVFIGKPTSEWVADLGSRNSKEIREQATSAIQKLGTNAIPYLLNELRDLDKMNLQKHYSQESAIHRYNLQSAFVIIGADAEAAVPELIAITAKGGTASCSAAHALTVIGLKGVVSAVSMLTNGPLPIRICIAQIIADAGTNATIAIPALLECSRVHTTEHDLSVQLRSFAVGALSAIGANAETVVPALIVCLHDENAGVRFSAVRALGRFGKRAQSAVPALNELKKDPQYHVRGIVDSTLQKISP